MKPLKWITPSLENIPPKDEELIVKFKHGIVSAWFDIERFERDGSFVFNTYIWRDVEGYIYEFITLKDFEKHFGDND